MADREAELRTKIAGAKSALVLTVLAGPETAKRLGVPVGTPVEGRVITDSGSLRGRVRKLLRRDVVSGEMSLRLQGGTV